MDEAGNTGGALCHLALLYRNADEYAATVRDFLAGPGDSEGSGESGSSGPGHERHALIAVPGSKQPLLDEILDPALRARATVVDMCELGRNPARILPAMYSFVDAKAGDRVVVVCEPAWPGRDTHELREAIRHEALINVAFAEVKATIVCLYDATELPPDVLADASRTHPTLAAPGRLERNLRFTGTGSMPSICDDPLPPVPARATVLAYRDNLRKVRDLTAAHARKAELAEPKAVDLVLAVSEIAANTLRHTPAGGTVSIWQTDRELICQLHDTGHISDPLVGRRPPDPNHPGGHGLWLVHQVCDLAEVRSDTTGTSVRLHMNLDPASQSAGPHGRWQATSSPDPCLS